MKVFSWKHQDCLKYKLVLDDSIPDVDKKELERKFPDVRNFLEESYDHHSLSDILKTVPQRRLRCKKELQCLVYIGDIGEKFSNKEIASVCDKSWNHHGCILYLIDTGKQIDKRQKTLLSLFSQRTGGFYQPLGNEAAGKHKMLFMKLKSCIKDSRMMLRIYPHLVDFLMVKLADKEINITLKEIKDDILERSGQGIGIEYGTQVIAHPTDEIDEGFNANLRELFWVDGCFAGYDSAEKYAKKNKADIYDIIKNVRSRGSVLERAFSAVFEKPTMVATGTDNQNANVDSEAVSDEHEGTVSTISRDFRLINLCPASHLGTPDPSASESSPVEDEDNSQISVRVICENGEISFRSIP